MAANSKIEWTMHTFNPWRGCSKVSDGCKHCYAETLAGRNPAVLGVWGPKGSRVVASESMWREPVQWNAAAQKIGERHRVFCASLADVFEGPETMPAAFWQAVCAARLRLFQLIMDTPHLDWLLLTKRPENWFRILGITLNHVWGIPYEQTPLAIWLENWFTGNAPVNVWMGTSVEDQPNADKRVPEILKIPAVVRFLSCEPLLGLIDLKHGLHIAWQCSHCQNYFNGKHLDVCPSCGRVGYWTGSHPFNPPGRQTGSGIDWVIVGGESGPHARPGHPDWFRSLRDQCVTANVPFFFKQWGEFAPVIQTPADNDQRALLLSSDGMKRGRAVGSLTNDGVFYQGDQWMLRIGKKMAGNVLDGKEWKQFPLPQKVAGSRQPVIDQSATLSAV